MSGEAMPYGIRGRHLRPSRRGGLRVLLVAVMGMPLLAALLGYLGGGPAERTTDRTAAAMLSVETQRVARSGNWFETQIVAVPARNVADLTVAVDRTLWRRMSIDTIVPDAESAEVKDGAYRYVFGPVGAGERFQLKLDGQLQPWGFRRLRGNVTLLDGERPLAQVPLTVTVLP